MNAPNAGELEILQGGIVVDPLAFKVGPAGHCSQYHRHRLLNPDSLSYTASYDVVSIFARP